MIINIINILINTIMYKLVITRFQRYKYEISIEITCINTLQIAMPIAALD